MFISKKRPIAVPQHEHGRMAGMLASIWGNDDFQRPVLDFDAFIKGVTLHDWGYGLIDNHPIGGTAEEDWLNVIHHGLLHHFDHPVTDIIVKLHIRRLLGFKQSAARTAMTAEVDELLSLRLSESGHSMEDFLWADRITNLCDFIAFYFAFEKPFESSYEVFSARNSKEIVIIHVQINSKGKIIVDPWPFSLESYHGFIFGYAMKGYPEVLDPVIMSYDLVQGS
jgi:hypothetical protein